jgi:hypothetical protein
MNLFEYCCKKLLYGVPLYKAESKNGYNSKMQIDQLVFVVKVEAPSPPLLVWLPGGLVFIAKFWFCGPGLKIWPDKAVHCALY